VRRRWRWALGPTEKRAKAAVLVAALPLGAAIAALVASVNGGPLAAAATGLLGLAATLATAAWLLTPRVSSPAMARVERIRAAEQALEVEVRESAPVRTNILVPIIDLPHFFGGYLGVFNLARRLAGEGLRVRLVTVDRQPRLPATWRSQLAEYEGLGAGLDWAEVEFAGDTDRPLEVSPRDSFLAVSAWTAQSAHRASVAVGKERFVYLIQEYEPLLFANRSMAAVARDSYRLPHRAVFSTAPLRDFFRERQLGVFSRGGSGGEQNSVVFRSAITPVGAVTEDHLRCRAQGLLFYARPEDHAARNLFELGYVALTRAISDGVFPGQWRFAGVGSIAPLAPLPLPGGRELELIPRSRQRAYAETLTEFTVGLSLMDSPHPSLLPIEMASAGLAVVTSTFATKDEATLAAISPNIIAAPPAVGGVSERLRTAVRRSHDPAACALGSTFDWPTSWDQALGPDVVASVAGWLRA
jgi:hypothetical protein